MTVMVMVMMVMLVNGFELDDGRSDATGVKARVER